MKKVFLPFTIVLFVGLFTVSCAPRDVANDKRDGGSSYGGAAAGAKAGKKQTYVVDEDGERPPTCGSDKSDYKVVEIPSSDVEQVLSGEIKAALSAGNLNCFRVGAEVQIKITRDDDEVITTAVITKIEALAVGDLKKKQADLFALSIDEIKDRAKNLNDKLKADKNVDVQGMISVISFAVPGVSEQSVQEPATDLSISIYTKLDERPASCSKKSKTWTRISIPADQDANIKSGKVIAWYSPSEKNCFAVGTPIQVQEKDGPVRATVKITRIEVVPSEQLSSLHALAMGMSLADLQNLVNAQETYANIVFFEFISAPNTNTANEPVPQDPSLSTP